MAYVAILLSVGVILKLTPKDDRLTLVLLGLMVLASVYGDIYLHLGDL